MQDMGIKEGSTFLYEESLMKYGTNNSIYLYMYLDTT